MMNRTWALAALVPLTASGCLSEEASVGTEAQASVANDDGRWVDGKVNLIIDYDGSLGQTYCEESVDHDKPSGLPFTSTTQITNGVARWDLFTPLDFPTGSVNGTEPVLLISRSTNGGHTVDSMQGPIVKCILVPDDVSAQGVAHELGHAFGLKHEQQRPDAESYIEVHTETCVNPNNFTAYEQAPLSEVAILGPYDYDSIMHYSSRAGCCEEGEEWEDEDGNTVVCPATCRIAGTNQCAEPIIVKKNCVVTPTEDCEIDKYRDVSVGDINAAFRMYEKKLADDELGDDFGATAVTGDFDADGYLDVAIGAPDEYTNAIFGGRVKSGAVFLFRGTSDRLVAWKLLVPGIGAQTEGGRFGAALAAGDLDGDGRTDLAIGAPGERSWSNSSYSGGNVHLYQVVRTPRLDGAAGKVKYLGIGKWTTIDQAYAGAPLASGAEFGAALAIGDMSGDGRNDLAIGAPSGRMGTYYAGYVAVLKGRDNNTDPTLDKPVAWTYFGQGSLSNERHGERFGTALATVEQNNLGALVVGTPETGSGGSGAAYVFMPWTNGMVGMTELRPPSGGGVLPYMRFGSAIAAGDYGAQEARTFVAIGAPEMNGGRGAIYVFTGTNGLTWNATLEQSPTAQQNRLGGVLAVVDDAYGVSDALVAGLPLHDKGALTDAGAMRYYYASSASSPPLAFDGASTLVENPRSSAAAGDHFGTSVATAGVYSYYDGHQTGRSLVVGGDGFKDGGGVLVQETLLYTLSTWQLFHQESADPE